MNYSKIRRLLFSAGLFSLLFSVSTVHHATAIGITDHVAPGQSADQISHPKKSFRYLIFDLGGVLFNTSHSGMSSELGLGDCIQYVLFGFKNPAKLKDKLFSILDVLSAPQHPDDGDPCAMADGTKMPGLMCKWMCGTLTGKEVVKVVCDAVDAGTCDTMLSSAVEKRLIKKLVRAIFDPNVMAKHTHPIKKGLELLRACSEREDLSLMVLSNYGADAFEELYNREEAQKIFRYFSPEKIVVSGFVGTMKPYHAMYEYLKKEFHLNPEECIIIDDQKENIDAAKKAGFETIWIKNGNFAPAWKKLKSLSII